MKCRSGPKDDREHDIVDRIPGLSLPRRNRMLLRAAALPNTKVETVTARTKPAVPVWLASSFIADGRAGSVI